MEQLEEEYYLFRVFWSGRAYLGAWVNVGTLQKPISHIHTGEAGAVLMAAGNGMPITETGFVKENRLDLSGDLQTGYQTGDSGRYYVVGCSSEKGISPWQPPFVTNRFWKTFRFGLNWIC